MSAVTMETDSGESEKNFEKHLDDLTGSGPIDLSEDEDEVPAKLDEKEPEPEAKEEADEPEPEIEAKAEEDDEEPGNLRLPKSEDEPEKVEAKEEEPTQTDSERKLAAAAKREASLQQEIRKLRADRRQAALQNQNAPVPTREPAPVVPDAVAASSAPGAQVVVSEDGTQVYLPDEEINRRVDDRVRAAMQPTPDQIRASNIQQLEQVFVGQDRERNQPIFDAAQKADDYISEALAVESDRVGFQPRNIQDVQSFIRQSGISDKVDEFFPDIAPILDEFVAAYASDNPMWKKSVLDRIGSSPTVDIAPDGGSKSIEKVAGAPQSLARKGGSRSVSPNSDEMEFEKLESAFRSDPIEFPDDKYKRYQALGRKLDRPGMD